MKIYLGTDHAGFEHKEKLKVHLRGLGYEVSDEGAFQYDPDDDYPDFIKIVAKRVASDPENSRGIIFGGSAQGEAMVANRFRGIRAAVYYGPPQDAAFLTRLHNDANILSIAARFVSIEETLDVVGHWLTLSFSDEERHLRRIRQIDYQDQETAEF
jgi:ribose 5-phosphate isomerase B